MKTALNRLNDLLGGNLGAAYAAAGHVLVTDGATGAIYTEEMAENLANRWEENLLRAEEVEDENERFYEHCQAYSLACSATAALREDEVPPAVAEALREESGIVILTWGW